jgi:DNA polymerase III delta prime subunit
MEHYLFVEKYRPKTVEDTILPARYKDLFKDFVKQGNIPNLLLCGSPGVGKTTIAKAMIDELDSSFLFLNGSSEANMDALRNDIKQFATTTSLSGGRKYVILDEADGLSHHVQPALRTFMEEYSANCGFILTCNRKHKIIEALQSRCSLVEFNFTSKDKVEIGRQLFDRITDILDAENVEYDKKVLIEFIKKYFPDIRKMLNELQKYSSNGKIDTGLLVDFDDTSLTKLIQALQNKNLDGIRKWVTENEIDQSEVYTKLYDVATKYVKPASIPQLILILADYDYKASFATNPEINLAACLFEIGSEVEWND